MSTTQPSLKELELLVRRLIFPFYEIKRDATLPTEMHRQENDAEHSWSLALIACSLAAQIDPRLDIGKLCQFAIVHDLVEVYAGDTSVWDKEGLKSKTARETAALKQLRKETASFPWIAGTIQSYEHKKLPEARFVWAVDKFLAVLMRSTDNGHYYHQRKITKEYFMTHLQEQRQKAHAHPAVGQYYDELCALLYQKPGYFYDENSD